MCACLSDTVCSSELSDRDQKLKDLEDKYSRECKLKAKAEKQRDKLAEKLVSTLWCFQYWILLPVCFQRNTEEDLLDHKQQVSYQGRSRGWQVHPGTENECG